MFDLTAFAGEVLLWGFPVWPCGRGVVVTGAVGGVRPKRIGAVERGKAGALGMKKISGSGAALTEPFVVGGRARNARKGQRARRFGRTAAGGDSAGLGWRAADKTAPGRGWGVDWMDWMGGKERGEGEGEGRGTYLCSVRCRCSVQCRAVRAAQRNGAASSSEWTGRVGYRLGLVGYGMVR